MTSAIRSCVLCGHERAVTADRLRAPRCPPTEQLSPSAANASPATAAGGTPLAGHQRRAPRIRPPRHGGRSALRPVPTQRKDDSMSSQLILIVEENAEHPHLPRRPARSRRLRDPARRQPPARAAPPRQPPATARARGHQRADARAARRCSQRRGAGRRDRPEHAADRAHRPRGRARRGCGCSTAAATTSSRSRSPTRSCADGSARCCAEHTNARPRGSAGSAR